MKKFALVFLALGIGGCAVIVTPDDAAKIDNWASNQRAMAHSVHNDGTIPLDIRNNIIDNANTSTFFGDWANGRKPSTNLIIAHDTTQPATQP